MAIEIKITLEIVATLGISILAGILIGTGMAQCTAEGLPAPAWIMRFQLEDKLFAKAMPPLMLGTLASVAAAAFLSQGTPRALYVISLLLMLVVLVVTVALEVPLNRHIQSWAASSPLPEWQHIRDLWLQRHVLRAIAALVASVSALIALRS